MSIHEPWLTYADTLPAPPSKYPFPSIKELDLVEIAINSTNYHRVFTNTEITRKPLKRHERFNKSLFTLYINADEAILNI